MTPAADVIRRALDILPVIAAGEAIQPEDMAVGLEKLNDLLHGLRRRGVNYAHQTIPTTSDPVPMPDQDIFDVSRLLAASLAEVFGVPVPDASSSLRALQAAYLGLSPSRVDGPLDRTPASARYRTQTVFTENGR